MASGMVSINAQPLALTARTSHISRKSNTFYGGRVPLRSQRAYPSRCARDGKVTVSASAAPPKRIAIIGGGPAGLTFALALHKMNNGAGAETIQVFEQYSSLKPALGAGFNINGGAVMLCKLGLEKELKAIGKPFKRVLARTVTGDLLFDVDVPAILPESLKYNGEPVAYTVMRSDLQRVLESTLPEGMVKTSSKITAVYETDSGAVLRFAGGEVSEEFDLVVACDGIKSVVRKEVTNTETAPIYSGIRVLFVVAPPGTYPKPDGEIHQWFGDGTYALCYTGGVGDDGRDMLALCIANDKNVSENTDWTEGDTKDVLLKMLKEAAMPSQLAAMVNSSERIFDIGVHYHDTLATWNNGSRLVLLGDSAHAMPPFMGQGANQAMQDAYCLASKLGGIGAKQEFADLAEALRAYEGVRILPTSAIMQISRLNGFIETQRGPGATARDLLFKTLGKLGIPGQIFLQNAIPRV